ncbi:MAG: outer membrane beta-barrel protein [Polyangiaceae bacterium]|jgi:hypothetical protein
MKTALPWIVSGAVAAVLCVPQDAFALGPVGVEIGAKVGAGTNPTGDSLNPLGFGVGARAGVSVFNIYAGLSFMYYFGSSGDVVESSDKRSGKAMLYGFEGGYSFDIVHVLTIRPQLGIGEYKGDYSGGALTTGTADGKDIYLEPGVTLVVPLGFWFVGADANLILLPGQSGSRPGFTFHGQLGLNF